MISASLSFSSNSSSAVAAKSSERWLNEVRRYSLDASSARFRRFSISASSKEETSFTFSPVAGLIEAIGICLTKRASENEQRWNALSSTRWQVSAALPPNIRAFGGSILPSSLGQGDPPIFSNLLGSERD